MLRIKRQTLAQQPSRFQRHSHHFRLDAFLVAAIAAAAFAVVPRLSDLQNALQNQRQVIAASVIVSEPPRENPSLARERAADASTAALIQQLGNGSDLTARTAAQENLRQMPDAVSAPALFDALTNTDPIIRARVAEILAQKKPVGTLDVLTFTTYDPEPSVRLAAVQALGEIASPLALPRVEQIQFFEMDAQVRSAAQQAEKKIFADVAEALGRPQDHVRAIAVAPSSGRTYAATWDGVYAPRGMGWEMQSRFPDLPTALAVSPVDADTLYLGTSELGILRSGDGGKTWNQLDQSLPGTERTTVTAIVVSPTNPRIIFATLSAWFDTVGENAAPIGLYMSQDAGDTWNLIAKWPQDYVTLRMMIDPIAPNYLFGMTETSAWRFPLGKVYCESC